MKKLIIVGDSAFAEVAFEYFTHDSSYEVVAFAVEKAFRTKNLLCGLPVIDFEELEKQYPSAEHEVFVAVVYTQLNRLRKRLADEAKSKGYRLASYISSRAFVWSNVEVGEHCFIFEDNTVQPFVKIGNNVVLWSGNHIGHHSTVRDHVFVSSHVVISGFCDVGEYSFLGVNSTIANNVTIGKDSWIGPAAVVMKDTDEQALVTTTASEASKVKTHRYFRIRE